MRLYPLASPVKFTVLQGGHISTFRILPLPLEQLVQRLDGGEAVHVQFLQLVQQWTGLREQRGLLRGVRADPHRTPGGFLQFRHDLVRALNDRRGQTRQLRDVDSV